MGSTPFGITELDTSLCERCADAEQGAQRLSASLNSTRHFL